MGLLHLRSRSQWRLKMSLMIFSESRNILLPNVVLWCSIISQSVMPKFLLLLLLPFRSRSQRGLIWSKYDSFHYIFWTVDSLATKLGLMIHHHKQECSMKKIWITAFSVKVTVKGQKINVLSRWYFLKHQMFCFQTWYCDALLWVGVSCKKIDLLFLRSRSMQELIWSKYDNFYCVFWSTDPFITKLGLIVHYYKPECLMEKLDCCVQGQGHSKISDC